MIKNYHVIGLMSGSSLDGLDIAYCQFEIERKEEAIYLNKWQILNAETIAFSEKWADRLSLLSEQNALIYAQTNTYFGYYMGELVNSFIEKYNASPDFIASHGHTVFHLPHKLMTAQIGDGAALAAKTGYTVISNFRAQDVALEGEGAPIAPIADKWLFPQADFLLNLGGIVNISCKTPKDYIAFDIGGCNQVLNALSKELGKDFDEDGKLASQGEILDDLFEEANRLPYFQLPYPKSLSNQWVQKKMVDLFLNAEGRIEDKLRTATEQISYQVAKSMFEIIQSEKLEKSNFQVLATGGGALNKFLMENIKSVCEQANNFTWIEPDPMIIEFKEAILMALMGVLRMEKTPNVIHTVTGAKRNTIGGAVHLP